MHGLLARGGELISKTFRATHHVSYCHARRLRFTLVFARQPPAVGTQHWRPPFVSLKEHPQNATQEETQKGASSRRLIPSG
jgi:hypothetical protein